MNRATTIALDTPPTPMAMAPDLVASGPPIPPIERIKLFSPNQWEDFVLEWAHSLNDDYSKVERCAGPGDLGRDIVAICEADGEWDNYQCKHYAHPLTPSDIWIELAKLVHHTRVGQYSWPRKYYLVAPRGAGTKLSNLLRRPADLKAGLLEAWSDRCQTGITSTRAVKLDGALAKYIEGLAFGIFETVPPLRLIDQHSRTRWHVFRFGGGLPPRPEPNQPPDALATNEAGYVRALLDAYGDHLGKKVTNVRDFRESQSDLVEHFDDSRVDFYSAESLHSFSRDTLPPESFGRLQDEVHSGIKDDIRGDHTDGYRRVLAVTATARVLQLSAHPLRDRISVRDRGGICHQLANDRKVKWTK